jgi:hypothetical protein
MGNRSRKLVAIAVAALTLATACGNDDGGNGDDSGGGAAEPTPIASPDEVLKVVDKGFSLAKSTDPESDNKTVSYGFVIENVSDEVAVTVRVGVKFTDDAGDPFMDLSGSDEFSVVLPGQRIGSGGSENYDGEAFPADMTVAVTLIASLDTPDGERHRQPPGPYAELQTGTPAEGDKPGGRQAYTVDVTNTYDIPIRPRVTAVWRGADGAIVGGATGTAVEQEIQPGASAPATFVRTVSSPKVMQATIETYAEPAMGKVILRKPVWQSEV